MHINKKLFIKLKTFSIPMNSKQLQEPRHSYIKQIIGLATQHNKVKKKKSMQSFSSFFPMKYNE